MHPWHTRRTILNYAFLRIDILSLAAFARQLESVLGQRSAGDGEKRDHGGNGSNGVVCFHCNKFDPLQADQVPEQNHFIRVKPL